MVVLSGTDTVECKSGAVSTPDVAAGTGCKLFAHNTDTGEPELEIELELPGRPDENAPDIE